MISIILVDSPTSGLLRFLVAQGGIEPPTQGFFKSPIDTLRLAIISGLLSQVIP